MPVVLDKADIGPWLKGEAGTGLLKPAADNRLRMWPVLEETGVWARIAADLGDVSFTVNGAVITVRVYLMQAVGRGLRKDRNRQHVWLPLQQAVARASHVETRELVQAAE